MITLKLLKKKTKQYFTSEKVWTIKGLYLHLGIVTKDIFKPDSEEYIFLMRNEFLIEDKWAKELWNSPQGKQFYLQNNFGWTKEGKQESNLNKLNITLEIVDGTSDPEES